MWLSTGLQKVLDIFLSVFRTQEPLSVVPYIDSYFMI